MAQGSNVPAVKADLVRMGKKVLLVEGRDDWHNLDHLLKATTGTLPSYELGHCDNDDGVLDLLTGMTEASQKTQTALGAILDADEEIQARIRSLQGRLGKYYAIPADFPQEGLIVPPSGALDGDRLPILGIWLMPDNQRGIFEDLLIAAMTPRSKEYVSGVVDQATIDGMTGFRKVERSKAIVKTHIAWQNPNMKNLGEAIGAYHFENLAPTCTAFLNWLAALFGEAVE